MLTSWIHSRYIDYCTKKKRYCFAGCSWVDWIIVVLGPAISTPQVIWAIPNIVWSRSQVVCLFSLQSQNSKGWKTVIDQSIGLSPPPKSIGRIYLEGLFLWSWNCLTLMIFLSTCNAANKSRLSGHYNIGWKILMIASQMLYPLSSPYSQYLDYYYHCYFLLSFDLFTNQNTFTGVKPILHHWLAMISRISQDHSCSLDHHQKLKQCPNCP